jgi:protoporphyrinogen oxidase
MSKNPVVILGGGVAGLATGYYLTRLGIDVLVLEAQSSCGGNCRTIEKDGFSFDTGAHRFHDRNRAVTEDLHELLGKSLIMVQAPSMIFDDSRLINFPIRPVDILTKMSPLFSFSAMLSLVKARVLSRRIRSFEDFAISSYGRLISSRFLLNYSSKLWGIPCCEISRDIAGKRLNGINLSTMLMSLLSKDTSRKAHYEGEFLYPVGGIQRISDALISAIGRDKVLTGKKITGIRVDRSRVSAIEINSCEKYDVGSVVSTLPLSTLITMMNHTVPERVQQISSSLRFRNIRLAAFSLNRAGVNGCSTMYFPDTKYMFTRIYEPRNRFVGMSPEGKTMLVAEVPCFQEDTVWRISDDELTDLVKKQILETGIIEEKEIISQYSVRLDNAYPVLEDDYLEKTSAIIECLSELKNLYLNGRNSLFRYSWIHDLFNEGKATAERIAGLRHSGE